MGLTVTTVSRLQQKQDESVNHHVNVTGEKSSTTTVLTSLCELVLKFLPVARSAD